MSLSACHDAPKPFLAALEEALDCSVSCADSQADDPHAWAHTTARALLSWVSQSTGVAVCLDNVEALRHPSCRALLELLIESWPRGHLLYCAGRSLRGVRVGRALLDGRAVELGPTDLALDSLELAELARQLNGDEGSLEGIESATFLANGWLAGARALLLSNSRPERVTQSLPLILERYFEERVCGALQPEQARRLMELATINTFNAALLGDLPDDPLDWDEIERLADAGVYFERLDADWDDDAQPWYRIQPLLAQFLALRHKRMDSRRVSKLHRFAAEWFERRGIPDEAVRHALQCRDNDFSTALLERAGALGVGLRQGIALFRSSGGLSDVGDAQHPLLDLGKVYLEIQEGRVAEARSKFETLRIRTDSFRDWGESLPGPDAPSLADLLESILEKYEDRPRSLEGLRRLQLHVDAHEGDPIVRATHASLLALAYLGNGMFHEAQTVCEIGLGAVRNLRARHTQFCLRIQQAHAAIALGQLQEAALYVERARELAVAAPGGWPQGIALADVLRGVLYYESNEIEEAEKLLWRALPREPLFTGWFEIYAVGFSAKVAVARMRCGGTAAVEVLTELESLSQRCRMPRLADLAAILRLQVAVRSGSLSLAAELLQRQPLSTLTDPVDHADSWELRLRTPALLEAARSLAADGRFRDALDFLNRTNRRYVYDGDARQRFEYLVLSATISFRLARFDEAFDTFVNAMDLGLQARLTRRLLNHRTELLEIFDRAVSVGQPLPARSARFCNSVLRNAQDTEPRVALERKLLVEPRALPSNEFNLTPRETEILAFVAEGLSSKEISYRLSVSESTVKTHRKKVYMKLGVSRRSQAIARARAKSLT